MWAVTHFYVNAFQVFTEVKLQEFNKNKHWSLLLFVFNIFFSISLSKNFLTPQPTFKRKFVQIVCTVYKFCEQRILNKIINSVILQLPRQKTSIFTYIADDSTWYHTSVSESLFAQVFHKICEIFCLKITSNHFLSFEKIRCGFLI